MYHNMDHFRRNYQIKSRNFFYHGTGIRPPLHRYNASKCNKWWMSFSWKISAKVMLKCSCVYYSCRWSCPLFFSDHGNVLCSTIRGIRNLTNQTSRIPILYSIFFKWTIMYRPRTGFFKRSNFQHTGTSQQSQQSQQAHSCEFQKWVCFNMLQIAPLR